MKKYLLVIFLAISACSTPQETLVPPHVSQTESSFSESGKQDSGVIAVIPGKGFELTASTVERYKALASKFSEQAIGLSVENGKHIISNEGMVLFLDLNEKNLQK